jgi:hypothetical protein
MGSLVNTPSTNVLITENLGYIPIDVGENANKNQPKIGDRPGIKQVFIISD